MSILPDASFSGPDAGLWATRNQAVVFSKRYTNLMWVSGGGGTYNSTISIPGMTSDGVITAIVSAGSIADCKNCPLIATNVGTNTALLIVLTEPLTVISFEICVMVSKF